MDSMGGDGSNRIDVSAAVLSYVTFLNNTAISRFKCWLGSMIK